MRNLSKKDVVYRDVLILLDFHVLPQNLEEHISICASKILWHDVDQNLKDFTNLNEMINDTTL